MIPNIDPNLIAELRFPGGRTIRRRVLAFGDEGDAMIATDEGALTILRMFGAEDVRLLGLDLPTSDDGDDADQRGESG